MHVKRMINIYSNRRPDVIRAPYSYGKTYTRRAGRCGATCWQATGRARQLRVSQVQRWYKQHMKAISKRNDSVSFS